MEKVEPTNEEITLDFDIPESGYNWTKKQLDAFDARMRSDWQGYSNKAAGRT